MKATIKEFEGLSGEVNSSPSKSYSHRAFFLSTLSGNKIILKNPLVLGDVEKSIESCRLLGAEIKMISNDSCEVIPSNSWIFPNNEIDCGNSGTTIRILTALSILFQGTLIIKGSFFDRERPMDDLLSALENIGAMIEKFNRTKNSFNGLKIELKQIKNNRILIKGDVSSQFITGLIIALVILMENENIAKIKEFSNDTFTIKTTTKVKSFPYLQITQEICNDFGYKNFNFNLDNQGKLEIQFMKKSLKNNNEIKRKDLSVYNVPGDFSSAAFMIGAGALFAKSSGVKINNLNHLNPQGDKEIISILKEMGAIIDIHENDVFIKGRIEIFDNSNSYIPYLQGITVDCNNIPDLFPILCSIGALSKGITKLINISHIRHKETDRVSVMIRELRKFNIQIEELNDEVIIHGIESNNIKNNQLIQTEKDHRIVMAMCIFSLALNKLTNTIKVLEAEYHTDSFPTFFEDLGKLGAEFVIK